MRVRIDQAGHEDCVRLVQPSGALELTLQLSAGAHCDNLLSLNRHCAIDQDAVLRIHRDNGSGAQQET